MDIREVAKSAAEQQGYPEHNLEQLDFEETYVKIRNVFVILPISYGTVWPHA